MNRIICVLLLMAVYSSSLQANVIRDDILSSGTSTRAAAMGSAFTAVADDPGALYFNSAGLADIRRFTFLSSYGSSFGMVEKKQISLAGQALFGTVGIGYIHAGSAGIPRTDSLGVAQGTFSYGETACLVGYGQKILDGSLRLGTTVKYLSRECGSEQVGNIGFDTSLLLSLGSLRLGVTVHDVGDTVLGADTREQSIRYGVACTPFDGATVAADYYQDSLKLGTCLRLSEQVNLLGGYEYGFFSIGVGLRMAGMVINIGYTAHDAGNNLAMEIGF